MFEIGVIFCSAGGLVGIVFFTFAVDATEVADTDGGVPRRWISSEQQLEQRNWACCIP